jgi:GMP synthase-like glutamine amidotransferase
MRVLAIVNDSDAGPGVFLDVLRERGDEVHSWMLPGEGPPGYDPREFDAVIVLGGAAHPDQEEQHRWIAEERALLADLLEREVPVLGVCLGAQLLGVAAGGRARRLQTPEIGFNHVQLSDAGRRDPLTGPLAPGFEALGWHSYEVLAPPGAQSLASSAACLQAFRTGPAAWGIQFHAEVTEADFEAWIEDARRKRDPFEEVPDLDALQDAMRAGIGAWNELGRGLCERFLTAAEAAKRPQRLFRSVRIRT